LFFLAEEEFFLLLLVVFDARRLDDDDDDDDVNREDAVSADIVIVAKTYSIAPPWIYVSDVSSEKARFENSPLLGSRPRAADSAGESKSRQKKKTMMWGARFLDFFFFCATIAARGARVFLALCCCLQKSCTDLARSRRRSKLPSTTN